MFTSCRFVCTCNHVYVYSLRLTAEEASRAVDDEEDEEQWDAARAASAHSTSAVLPSVSQGERRQQPGRGEQGVPGVRSASLGVMEYFVGRFELIWIWFEVPLQYYRRFSVLIFYFEVMAL